MSLEAELALTNEVLPEQAKTSFDHLEVAWIEEALAATGAASVRTRRLPAEQMVWLVIGMAMMRNRSIVDVVDKMSIALPSDEGAVAPSAVAQARKRLGSQPIEWLFRKSATQWTESSSKAYSWRQLRVFGVDGTRFAVPDSEENNEAFHKHVGGNGMSGYPLMRTVDLMCLGSRLCRDAEMGSFATPAMEVARPLWERIPDDSLTIVDEGFFNAPALVPLAAGGTNRHWLTRARTNSRWKVIKQLGPGDMVVEIGIEPATRKLYPALPKVWTMRAVEWRKSREGTMKYLVTSLLDATLFPAEEMRAMYVERWEQELAFDDLKTEQLEGIFVLRSRSPDGVRQELWGTLLAYNLIRLEMQAIARHANLPPRRVSFVQSLRLIRDEWLWLADTRSPGAIPKQLARLRRELTRLILPPRRKRTTQPRVVKPRPRRYDSKPTALN